MSDPAAVDALAQRVVDELGRVDIVVNNAGAARGADRVPVIDLDLELWHRVIDVNLHGTFYMSRTFGRRLVEQGDGRQHREHLVGRREDDGGAHRGLLGVEGRRSTR